MEVLINQATRCWRREVIDHCFNAIEAEVIKSIPLSTHAQRDTLVWPFTPNGHYTVNSGYRFLAEESSIFQLPHQSVLHSPVCWKKLWKMNVPNKIKNFVWRSCREALLTKANLYRRKITVDAICDQCKVRTEDCSHAIFFFILMCRKFGQRTSNGNGYQHCRGRQQGRFSITRWRKTKTLHCWCTRLGHCGTIETNVESHSTH